MNKLSTSLKVYFLLVLVLAASNAVQVLLPSYQGLVPNATLPAPPWVVALANAGLAIVIYGGLGFAGLMVARKLGFTEIWAQGVTNRQRFLTPGLIGAGLGVFVIVLDIVFSNFNGVGRITHPPFPSSLFASLSAGIGEEIIFRLFFISFWTWLISSIILRGKGKNPVFWVIAVLSALAFSAGHIPTVMLLYNYSSVGQVSPALLVEIVLLTSTISIFAAYYLRKYGFLAAVGIHFWTDIVWHVVWGLF